MQELKNKKTQKKLVFLVEKTETGFSSYSNEFPIFTTGKSIPELMNNIYEAVDFYFEDQNATIKRDDITFEIDFQQFFKHYNLINAKHLGKKIGMNPTLLSQYVSGTKKPSIKQTQRILDGIHQIGLELSSISLLPIQ